MHCVLFFVIQVRVVLPSSVLYSGLRLVGFSRGFFVYHEREFGWPRREVPETLVSVLLYIFWFRAGVTDFCLHTCLCRCVCAAF